MTAPDPALPADDNGICQGPDELHELHVRYCIPAKEREAALRADVRRLSTRIAAITTADEQAVLAIARVEAWCDQQDALSNGESLTTAAVRAALADEEARRV